MTQTRERERERERINTCIKYEKPAFSLHMDKQTANYEEFTKQKPKTDMTRNILASRIKYDLYFQTTGNNT